jgi:hypothetical protein
MTNLFRNASLLFLALFAGQAAACMPAFPSEELAREGRNILIGKVESTRVAPRPKAASAPALSSIDTRQLAAPELLVNVRMIRLLSGRAPATVTAVSPCQLPLKPGEKVVVATYSGRRVAFPANMYEESYLKVYQHGL